MKICVQCSKQLENEYFVFIYNDKMNYLCSECILTINIEELKKYREYTPEIITSLNQNEIFVFGSNVDGIHGAGAAKVALDHFGAIYRKGEGPQGQSYAIPTIDLKLGRRSVSLITIKNSLLTFKEYAETHPKLKFYVTKLGTNLAGYSLDEIKELFADIYFPKNVILPIEFDIR